MDAVHSDCSIGEVQALLNEFLRDKVTKVTRYEPEVTYEFSDDGQPDMSEHPVGDYVRVDAILADN